MLAISVMAYFQFLNRIFSEIQKFLVIHRKTKKISMQKSVISIPIKNINAY